jgi:hypothetical protein
MTTNRPKGQRTLQGFFTKKSKTTNATTTKSNRVNQKDHRDNYNDKSSNKKIQEQRSPEVLVLMDPVHNALHSMQDSKRHELLQIVMGKRVAAAATAASVSTTTPTTIASTDVSTTASTTVSSSSSQQNKMDSHLPLSRKMITGDATHSPSSTTSTTAIPSISHNSMASRPASKDISNDDNETLRVTRRTDEQPEPNRLNFEAEVYAGDGTKTNIRENEGMEKMETGTESSSSPSSSNEENKVERGEVTVRIHSDRSIPENREDQDDIHDHPVVQSEMPMESLQQLVEDVDDEETKTLTPQDLDTRSTTTSSSSSSLSQKEIQATTASPETLKFRTVPPEQQTEDDSPQNNSQSNNNNTKNQERNALLVQQHEKMRETYTRRALELLERVRDMEPRQDHPLADGQFSNSSSLEKLTDEFPDAAIPLLASVIEGRSESLTQLTNFAAEILTQRGLISLPTEQIADKIKRLATRKNPIKNPQLLRVTSSSEQTAAPAVPLNVFEDQNPDYLWRWEVTVLEILPESTIATIKKARTARKKITSHLNALLKLITTIQEVSSLFVKGPTDQANNSMEPILARISQEEEKVLKYEREEEKNRLAAHAKRQKEIAREEARTRKQEEQMQRRERAAEGKRLEKERKKEQAEALKQQKAAEKEEQERKERAMKEASRKKQEKCLLSFFSNAAPGSSQNSSQRRSTSSSRSTIRKASHDTGASSLSMSTKTFPLETFRTQIASSSTSTLLPIFAKLSSSARQSRRRRAKQITVPVYVTVYPEGYDEANPFSQQQPYAELKDVKVRNKYKLLSFHEDIRPAYYGTWSKTSRVITGRNPFAKDTSFLDYDVDSEAEWEEGDDDEVGEELGDDKADENEDKEMEDADGDDADGWLAPDDEVEEELDDEAKQLLRKKKVEKEEVVKRALTVCCIAPRDGGRPWNVVSPETVPNGKMEGFDSFNDALALIKRLTATKITNLNVCLDAFPPSEDFDANQDAAQNPQTNTNGQGLTEEQMKVFVRFVHNNTLGSKDKMIDELLKLHKSVTNSRAQAFRVLDSLAEKKSDPLHGIFWEVKKEVLENLGLTELTGTKNFASDDVKQENMKTIARFIHHCTTSSKEKIVDDLRIKHPTATSSRAEAMRILLSISEKKKHPVSGYYWEVKKDVREDLGLKDLPMSEPPAREKTPSVTSDASSLATEPQIHAVDDNTTSQKKKKVGSGVPEKSRLKRPAVLNDQAKLLAAFVKKSRK